MEHERSPQVETQQRESSESAGQSLAPPAFSLSAAPADNTGVVQRQEAPDAQVADPQVADAPEQVDPFAGLSDEHRNPLTNSNTSEQNLILLIQEWEANDSTHDDRKLAHIISTSMHESGETFQSINENLDRGYFPAHYAPTGYWGRGFVQLTWERNYESMGDEIGFDLEDHREAAILPTISAYTTANGMLDGDFTGRSLNDYLPSEENEQGEQVQGEADWFNARRVVNGVGRPGSQPWQNAQNLGDTAEDILVDITAYRTGIENETIAADVTLASYLYDETDHFQNYKDSDAIRMTQALGYSDFQTPNMAGGTDMQQQYQTEVGAAGHGSSLRSINTNTEREAIRAFQVAFNQNHHLVTPLPETGRLDDRTHEMMMLDGNRIAAGNVMIEAAFGGQVEAINLYQQALENHQAGNLSMNGLALEIHSYMPARTVGDVTSIFDALGGNAVNFAHSLARAGHTHDRLAIINPQVLERMNTLLSASSNEAHQAQATRVNAVINYSPAVPSGEFNTHVVASGETLSVIARQYDMTYQALGDLNNIPPPYNSIRVGQELRVPNPDFDPTAPVPDAPQPASTIAPLVDNGPEAETTTETETTTTTPTPTPDTSGGEQVSEQAGGTMKLGQALKRAWQSVKSFLSNLFS